MSSGIGNAILVVGSVEVLGRRVDARFETGRIGERRLFGALERVVQEALHDGGDLILLVVGQVRVRPKPGAEALDGILHGPLLEHLLRHVERVVMHRMTFHAQRQALDQGRASALTRLLDCSLRLSVHGEDVGAVDDNPFEAVRGRAVRDVLDRVAEVRRSGVGPLVVVADEHHGQLPHTGHVHALVRVSACGEPSPNHPSATRRSPRILNASAIPTATGSIAGDG